MSPFELMALSLGVSILVAGLGGAAATVLVRRVADTRLKDHAWAVALWAPLLPPLLTVLLLVTPVPVQAVVAAPVSLTASAPTLANTLIQTASPAPSAWIDAAVIGGGLVGLALLLSLARGIALGVRALRLRRLLRTATNASPDLTGAVEAAAQTLGLTTPTVRVSAAASQALLAGLIRPMLILPSLLAEAPDAAEARAVIAHELAHLKRRDHLVLWAEEGLLIALAFNPLTPLLRHRRAAAREEACDALALGDADPAARRLYAQTLIEALRRASRSGDAVPAPTLPALTFTGSQRSFAMNRLKAVLNPAPVASRGARLTALVAGLLVVGVAGGASIAVAAQREPEVVIQDQGLTLDEADGQTVAVTDAPWLEAAMAPIYKAVWPQACGYGSNPDGSIFVHVGKGCTPGEASNPVIQTLAGISPSQSPRAAFLAVKAACDARRPVAVVYERNGARTTTAVACTIPAMPPARQNDLTVGLTYAGLTLEPGDKLEVALVRQEGDNAWRRSLAFDLAGQTRLPDTVTARVDPELFRGGAPRLKATLYARDGSIRAVSGERPLPMLINASSAIARVILTPVAVTRTVGEGQASLTAEQGLRYANPTAVALKQFCAGDTPDAAYCDGAMFGAAVPVVGQQAVICPPLTEAGDMDVHQVVRQDRPALAAANPAEGQSRVAFVREVMARTFPCDAGRAGGRVASLGVAAGDDLGAAPRALLPVVSS